MSACRSRVFESVRRKTAEPPLPSTTCAPENRGRSAVVFSRRRRSRPVLAYVLGGDRLVGRRAYRRGGCSEKTRIVFATRARTRTHRPPTGQLASACGCINYIIIVLLAPASGRPVGRPCVLRCVRACVPACVRASPRPAGVQVRRPFRRISCPARFFRLRPSVPPVRSPTRGRASSGLRKETSYDRRFRAVVFFKSLPSTRAIWHFRFSFHNVLCTHTHTNN